MSKLDRFLGFDRKIEQILSAEKDQHVSSEHTESALGGRGGISVGYPPQDITQPSVLFLCREGQKSCTLIRAAWELELLNPIQD